MTTDEFVFFTRDARPVSNPIECPSVKRVPSGKMPRTPFSSEDFHHGSYGPKVVSELGFRDAAAPGDDGAEDLFSEKKFPRNEVDRPAAKSGCHDDRVDIRGVVADDDQRSFESLDLVVRFDFDPEAEF